MLKLHYTIYLIHNTYTTDMADPTSLLSSEQILGALAHGIDEALVVYDADFTIRMFNARAEDVFAVKADAIIGTRFLLDTAQEARFQLLSFVMYSSLASTVVSLSDPGANPHVIKVILDNPHREFIVATYQISDVGGGALGFVKIVRDATREAELLKSKGDFITIAAHQLRTPATAIGWTFENLEKDQSLSSDAREAVRTGRSAAQNLLALVANLLNAAQIEDGRFGYQLQSLDLVSFLDGILAASIPIARHYNVNVYFERPQTSTVMVSADVQKLSVAVANILDNAIKYNVSDGQVVAGIVVDGDNAKVFIRDTGMGIPAEDASRLFEKFFRAKNAKKIATEGLGLGLYLVKNIIESHKGKIWVESVVGRGSTFYFTIPLQKL